MKNKYLIFISLFTIIIVSLTSCSGSTKKALGLGNTIPDERNVSRRPDLSIPPNFNLPSPKEDQKLRTSKKLTSSDKKFISKFTKSNKTYDNLTSSDKNFMKKFSKQKTK